MTRRRSGALPKREPNGRHDRALDRLVDARSPTEVRRLRDAALAGLRAPEWGSELGRLLLQSKLTPTQYEAGRRYGMLVQAYHAAIEAPTFPTTSLRQNAPRGRSEAPPDAERHVAAINHYNEANIALRASPLNCRDIVSLVCERDAAATSSEALFRLKIGLDALAALWHIPP